MRHWQLCEAPICAGYPTEYLTWFPDEKICRKVPYTKWQKAQIKIQKLYKQGLVKDGQYFIAEILENLRRIRRPRGIKSDSAKDYALWQ